MAEVPLCLRTSGRGGRGGGGDIWGGGSTWVYTQKEKSLQEKCQFQSRLNSICSSPEVHCISLVFAEHSFPWNMQHSNRTELSVLRWNILDLNDLAIH